MTSNRPWRDPEHGGFNGWIDAGLFVLAVSSLNIVYAYAAQHDVHPLVFVLYATAGAAAAMLCVTGLGNNTREVLSTPLSWVYGCATIAMEAFYFLLVSVAPPAEASLMARLAIPASLLFGWLTLGRSFGIWTFLGALIVIAAILPLFFMVGADVRGYAFLFAMACAVVVSIKSFSSEFHPTNQKAKTVLGKLQLTGLVVLATALLGMLAMTGLILLAEANLIPKSNLAPEMKDIWHVPTLLTAFLLGTPVLLAMNYLTFSSAIKITTENFLATNAFTPIGTLLFQVIAVAAGIIVVPDFQPILLIFIVLGIVGVLMIIREDLNRRAKERAALDIFANR